VLQVSRRDFSLEILKRCLDCGNGLLDDGEECDGGLGCLSTCVCDASSDYIPNNSTACAVGMSGRVGNEIDADPIFQNRM
jgi:hypothetical protein